MSIKEWIMSREGRKWLYAVAVAVVPLLVLYGAISQESAPLWMAVIAAFLGAASPVMALTHLAPKAPESAITIPSDLDNDVVLDIEED